MKFTVPTETRPELEAAPFNAPPLFANIVGERTLADDFAAASFLVLGAIPAALFLLMAILPQASPVCADAEVTIQGTAPSRARNDASPRPRAAEM